MKILILANEDDGLYRFRKELILKLKALNNEIFISVPSGEFKSYFEELGCTYIDTPVDRRGTNPISDAKLYFTYSKLIRKIKPDLIITYTIKCNIYGGFCAKLKHIPYAVNITGLGSAFESDGLIKKFVTMLYKMSINKAKVVFFENSENKDCFVNLNIVKEDICKVLHGAGVNLKQYEVLEPNSNDDTSFLFVGRIMKEKGVEELFEVARRCKKEGRNIRFDFIGDYEDNYKDIVDDLVNNKIINFYGFQKDIKPYVKNVDAVILPSYHEGMSNALLEGAALGRALLATNISGCKEAIEDGVSGYVFNKEDTDDLYKKVIKFHELSKDQKVQMGLEGRKLVEHNFDKDKVVFETIKKILN